MHGPYDVTIEVEGEKLELSYSDLYEDKDAVDAQYRYYSSGLGATQRGTEKLAAFYAALLLDPGQEADVEVFGFEGSGEKNRVQVGSVGVKRDAAGRAFLTLGSRWSHWRYFRGL